MILGLQQAMTNQYSMPAGLKSLQEAVCSFYNKHYELKEGAAKRALNPENVLVSGYAGSVGLCIRSSRGIRGTGRVWVVTSPWSRV